MLLRNPQSSPGWSWLVALSGAQASNPQVWHWCAMGSRGPSLRQQGAANGRAPGPSELVR